MKFIGSTEETLHLLNIDGENCDVLHTRKESELTILWFESDDNKLTIDGVDYDFHQNQMIFLTEFHRLEMDCLKKTRMIRFNRPFYCVLDHDEEVGCKGILFFGAAKLPIISIPKKEQRTFDTLWEMFSIEMQSHDSLQIEMLQMMLKRLLILCTRVYKSQDHLPEEKQKMDLIREFNFLVERHFKTKHSVKEYADMLFKSPKTLSNVFLKSGYKTPLQFIQERRMLEARRLLRHSQMQIKEIAYDIGFEDLQSFSRFFKKNEGVSPSEFREKRWEGKN